MKKMDSFGISLGEYVNTEIKYGVKTGFNNAFIIDKSTKERLVSEDPKSEEILKPIIVGDDIRKYELNYRDKYLIGTYIGVDIERYPAIKKYLESFKESLEKRWDKGNYYYELRACDYYDQFEKPKIVYPDIAKESRMTFDRDGLYLANTAYFIPTQDLYLLSLLNSKLIFNYYKRTAAVLGDADKGGRMRWFSQDVIRLPIRRISFTTSEPERSHLVAELKKLYEASKFGQVLAGVEACLSKDGHENSDVVHDFLAFLAEQIIEMNKEKQKETKGFLNWLESEVGAKVDELNPKTKIQGYYDLEFSELHTILKKNKRKLNIDPSRREPTELLRAEFQSSIGKLRPMRKRIEQTDQLIDQIVYRLYGLTEEEIKIVEGT